MKLLYEFHVNFFADESLRNKLIEVEKENIIAKQDGASSRVALEQERKKVRYLAGEEIVCSGCCVPKSSTASSLHILFA
jgi:aminoglycoside phosphotransferase